MEFNKINNLITHIINTKIEENSELNEKKEKSLKTDNIKESLMDIDTLYLESITMEKEIEREFKYIKRKKKTNYSNVVTRMKFDSSMKRRWR